MSAHQTWPSRPLVGETTRLQGPLPPAAPLSRPSARCGSRTAGRPAPMRPPSKDQVEAGRNPADIAGDADERRRVLALRARGVSWAHVALQLGRSEGYLRRVYDTPLKRDEAAEAATPRGLGLLRWSRSPLSRSERVLLAIVVADLRTASKICDLIGADRATVERYLHTIREHGWAFNARAPNQTADWQPTSYGLQRAAEIRRAMADRGMPL